LRPHDSNVHRKVFLFIPCEQTKEAICVWTFKGNVDDFDCYRRPVVRDLRQIRGDCRVVGQRCVSNEAHCGAEGVVVQSRSRRSPHRATPQLVLPHRCRAEVAYVERRRRQAQCRVELGATPSKEDLGFAIGRLAHATTQRRERREVRQLKVRHHHPSQRQRVQQRCHRHFCLCPVVLCAVRASVKKLCLGGACAAALDRQAPSPISRKHTCLGDGERLRPPKKPLLDDALLAVLVLVFVVRH